MQSAQLAQWAALLVRRALRTPKPPRDIGSVAMAFVSPPQSMRSTRKLHRASWRTLLPPLGRHTAMNMSPSPPRSEPTATRLLARLRSMGSGSTDLGAPLPERTRICERILGGRSGSPESSCLAPPRATPPDTGERVPFPRRSFQHVAHSRSQTCLVPDFCLPHVNADACLLPQCVLHHGVDRARSRIVAM